MVWGYICQQFDQTIYIIIAGFALAVLVSHTHNKSCDLMHASSSSWYSLHGPFIGEIPSHGKKRTNPLHQVTKAHPKGIKVEVAKLKTNDNKWSHDNHMYHIACLINNRYLKNDYGFIHSLYICLLHTKIHNDNTRTW